MAFVDRAEVKFQAGAGGPGLVSFRREKFRPRGGPDGGDGGAGGNIILVGSANQNTLAAYRYKKLLQAASGDAGGRRRRRGKSGSDLLVVVPVGTLVVGVDGQPLADLIADDQQVVIAKGGAGGFGNAHFASSTRQTPRVAENGEPGEAVTATLELKLIADVGLVGLPNAGKSTLLSVVSHAKPEIADYPFTTLRPNLGVVDFGRSSLLFADIPGLIAGASAGKGLGDEFLRHIERTSLLIHLIDFYNDDVAAAYQTIMGELKDYKVDLSRRPQIVGLTKTEGAPPAEVAAKLKSLQKLAPKGTPVLAISAQSGAGVKELLRVVERELAKARRSKPKAKATDLPVIGLKPADDDWQVRPRGDRWLVTGPKIERFARRTRFGDDHGEQRLRDIMHKLGIDRELERRGAQAEQVIEIGQPPIGRLEF